MHAILTPVGSSGDVNPFLTIGRALRQRGHDVTVLAPEPFARPAAAAGLEFVSTWPAASYDEATRHPDLWHPTRGVALVLSIAAQHLRRAYAQIGEVYRAGESMLVGHSLAFPTRVFEELHGVPAVTVHLAPSAFRSDFKQPVFPPDRDLSSWPRWTKRTLWWIVDRLMIDRHIAPALNAWRAELGLPPVARVFRSWLHSPERVLGLFPDWFAERQPDWPTELVLPGFVMGDDSHPPDLQVGHGAGHADAGHQAIGDLPVVFTPGSANRQAHAFFRAALEATERLGRTALLVTSYRDHLPASLPPHARHVPYAAFTTLFPRAAAVVHHGGIGTTAQALAAGVPQLLMPMGFDQPDNASRVVRLGAGASLYPAKFTGPRVAEALDRLVSRPEVGDACRRCAERISHDRALDRACDTIEATWERRRGARRSGVSASAHTGRR